MKAFNWPQVIKYIAVAMLGYVAARIIGDIRDLTFDHTIDPVAVIALLLSILLSVVFFRRFERLKYSDQLKKDAVIGRLKASVDNLFELEEKCATGDLNYTEIVKRLRRCRREFESYVQYAGALGCPVGDSTSSKYRLVCSELKDLLTNTPQSTDTDSAIRVSDGRIELSGGRLVEIERQIDDGKSILFEIEKNVILHMA